MDELIFYFTIHRHSTCLSINDKIKYQSNSIYIYINFIYLVLSRMISCCNRSISLSCFIISHGSADSPYMGWIWNPFKFKHLPGSVSFSFTFVRRSPSSSFPVGWKRTRERFDDPSWPGSNHDTGTVQRYAMMWNNYEQLGTLKTDNIHPFVNTQPQHW